MRAAALALACLALAPSCSRKVRPGTAPVEPTAFTDSENPVVSALPDRADGRDRAAGNVFVDPGAAEPVIATEAMAVLHPTRESSAVGVVRFRVVAGELFVFAAVDGLPAGSHAYHVHVFGDCSAPDASSAGPHFHYSGSAFDPTVQMITGNLGELRAIGAGTTTHQAQIPSASLQGPFSIIGRSVVVHELGNNPAVTPDGGAGRRIACGVIGVATPPPQQTTRR